MGRKIAVIILSTKSIALKDLLPHVPECLALLLTIKPGNVAKVPASVSLANNYELVAFVESEIVADLFWDNELSSLDDSFVVA
jgi:hypothetical protein